MEKHVLHVKAILQRLREARLLAKAESASFIKIPLNFGHFVSAKGISIDPKRVAIIQAWGISTSV